MWWGLQELYQLSVQYGKDVWKNVSKYLILFCLGFYQVYVYILFLCVCFLLHNIKTMAKKCLKQHLH